MLVVMPASSAPMADPSLLDLMQAAQMKLEWCQKYLDAALDKFEKAGITSFANLEVALEDNGQLLNEQIAALGFKKFHTKTLVYLKNYIQEERMRQRHKLQKLQAQEKQKLQAQLQQLQAQIEEAVPDATEESVAAQHADNTAETATTCPLSLCRDDLEDSIAPSEQCDDDLDLCQTAGTLSQEPADAPELLQKTRRLSAPLPTSDALPVCKAQRRLSAPPSALCPVQPSVKEMVPLPPIGECWEWPLTRIEKKSRVQDFDRMILVSENRELHQQLNILQDEHLCYTGSDVAEGDLQVPGGDLFHESD